MHEACQGSGAGDQAKARVLGHEWGEEWEGDEKGAYLQVSRAGILRVL